MLHTVFGLFAILGNLKFNHTISLDGLVNAALTGVMTAVGYGLKRVYCAINEYLDHIKQMSNQIEETSDVVDLHTGLLVKAGLAMGMEIPKVSKKRRREDRETIPI